MPNVPFGFEPGFDPGFFVGTSPELGPDFRAVSDALIRLTENATRGIANDLKAASTKLVNLQAKIADPLLSGTQQVVDVASRLSNKVEQTVANEFGGTMERTAALVPQTLTVQPPDLLGRPLAGFPTPVPIYHGAGVESRLTPAPIAGIGQPPVMGVPAPNNVDIILGNILNNPRPVGQPLGQPAAINPQPVLQPPQPAWQPPQGQQQVANPQPQIVDHNWAQEIYNQNHYNLRPQVISAEQAAWCHNNTNQIIDGMYVWPDCSLHQNMYRPAPYSTPQGGPNPATGGTPNPLIKPIDAKPTCVDAAGAGAITGHGVTDPANPASLIGVPPLDWCHRDSQGRTISANEGMICPPVCSPTGGDTLPPSTGGSGTTTTAISCAVPPDLPYCSEAQTSSFCGPILYPFTEWQDAGIRNMGFSFIENSLDGVSKDAMEANSGIAIETINEMSQNSPYLASYIKLGVMGVKGLINSAIVASVSFVKTNLRIVTSLTKFAVSLSGCSSPAVGASAGVQILTGLLGKYLGGPWDYLSIPTRYVMQGNCPLIYPSVDNAKAAYLGNSIDLETLKNWVQINGHCYAPFEKTLEVEQSKPVPMELIQLVRRGIISESEFKAGMRKLGYIKDEYVINLRKLGEYAPPPSDVIRMMVRDADDSELVNEFKLDTDFEVKYASQLKEWAKWSGVSDTYMKYLWRSHWDIPSPTQLFVMYHRLTRLDPSDPKYVSIENVKRALEQQDIAPYWIDKYLAISYNPLTRVDVRRAFNIGVLKRADVKNNYLDNGYSPENAETLTKFAEKQKLKDGYTNAHVRRYLEGRITQFALTIELAGEGYEAEDITKIITRAKNSFRWKNAGSCVKATKRRVFLGEFNDDQARNVLIGFGMDGEQADIFIEGWHCELVARGKELPAAKLLQLFDAGIIPANDLLARLKRLGFTDDSAVKMLALQQHKQAIIREKDAAKQLAMQQLAIKQQLREAEKAAAKAAREQRQSQQQQNQIQDSIARRDKSLAVCAAKLAKQEAIDVSEAFEIVRQAYKRVRQQYGLDTSEALQAVCVAIEQRRMPDIHHIDYRIDQVAAALGELPATVDA